MPTLSTPTLEFKDAHDCFAFLAKEFDSVNIDYTDEVSIVSIPFENGRRQNVRGFLRKRGEFTYMVFMSKVCESESYEIDYKALMEEHNHLKHSMFVLHHGHLEVKATVRFSLLTPDYLRQVVLEVAGTADETEHKITGEDSN